MASACFALLLWVKQAEQTLSLRLPMCVQASVQRYEALIYTLNLIASIQAHTSTAVCPLDHVSSKAINLWGPHVFLSLTPMMDFGGMRVSRCSYSVLLIFCIREIRPFSFSKWHCSPKSIALSLQR